MESPNTVPQFLLEKISNGSPEGAKLAAKLAEAGVGVPVSVSAEDVPAELLALFTSDAPGSLTATAVDISKKSDE